MITNEFHLHGQNHAFYLTISTPFTESFMTSKVISCSVSFMSEKASHNISVSLISFSVAISVSV